MPVDVLLGLQWGDEGKGKIVDILCPKYDIIARFQGGPNAGHTILINNKKFIFHTLPSGVIHPHTKNILGSGMVIDPITLRQEIESLKDLGIDIQKNIIISRKAHLILPSHKQLDSFCEEKMGKHKIGSTLKGIGPAYQDKTARIGIRFGNIRDTNFPNQFSFLREKHFEILDDKRIALAEEEEKIWKEAIDFLSEFQIENTEEYLYEQINKGKKVLAEGAQGSLLDIDHGTYPYVTSSSTVAAGACSGLGISPKWINEIFGVFKAYTTRVGEGPFITEQQNEYGEYLTQAGHEFGSTTGRKRRCGWLDLVALKYAVMINGVTSLIMTKPDVLSFVTEINACITYTDRNNINHHVSDLYFCNDLKPGYKTFPSWKEEITGIKEYTDLPSELKSYINFIEQEIKLPVKIISLGPERNQTIFKA